MRKRFFAVMLSAALIFTGFAPLSGVETSRADTELKDIKGHWAESYINKAVELGFVNGYEDGSFRPDNAVTRAEFVKMLNSAIGNRGESAVWFNDVGRSDWYYTDVRKAVAAAFVSGYDTGNFQPNNSITRQEAAVIISRVVPSAGISGNLRSFSDASSASEWANDALTKVTAKKYMGAYTDGKLHPKDNLTRAQTAKIICDILENETIVVADASLSSDGASLSGRIYANDVNITNSLGSGEASLENVVVLGMMNVQGGGDTTGISVTDSRIANASINKSGSSVRFVMKGETTVANLETQNRSTILTSALSGSGVGASKLTVGASANTSLRGDFPLVNINGAAADVSLENGNITELNVDGRDSVITLASTASVGTANANAACDFEGTGTISKLYVNVDGVTYETEPKDVKTASGVKISSGGSTKTGGLGMSFIPANGETGVSVDSKIIITFDSAAERYNGNTLTSSNIPGLISIRKDSKSGSSVSFTASINSKKTQITLTPKDDLAANTKYYVIVDEDSFRNSDGESNSAKSIYFTTSKNGSSGVSFTPDDGATGVSVSVKPKIVFDSNVTDYDGDELTTSYLKGNIEFRKNSASGAKVTFSASYSSSSRTITITPSDKLTEGQKYYLAVPEKSYKTSGGSNVAASSVIFTVGYETPTISNISVSSVGTEAEFTGTASDAGTMYGVIQESSMSAPTIAQIVSGKNSNRKTLTSQEGADNVTVKADRSGTLNFTKLTKGTKYTIYVVLRASGSSADSVIYSKDFTAGKDTATERATLTGLSASSGNKSLSLSPNFGASTLSYEVLINKADKPLTVSITPSGKTNTETLIGSYSAENETAANTIDEPKIRSSYSFTYDGSQYKIVVIVKPTSTDDESFQTKYTIYPKEYEQAADVSIRSLVANGKSAAYDSQTNSYSYDFGELPESELSAEIVVTATSADAEVLPPTGISASGSNGIYSFTIPLSYDGGSVSFRVKNGSTTKNYEFKYSCKKAAESR